MKEVWITPHEPGEHQTLFIHYLNQSDKVYWRAKKSYVFSFDNETYLLRFTADYFKRRCQSAKNQGQFRYQVKLEDLDAGGCGDVVKVATFAIDSQGSFSSKSFEEKPRVSKHYPHVNNNPGYDANREFRISTVSPFPLKMKPPVFSKQKQPKGTTVTRPVPHAELVMKYLDGPSLFDVLEADVNKSKPLSDEERIVLGRSLLEAGIKLHEAGIIHRDLNLQNMKVIDGQIVPFDFGLSILTTDEPDHARVGSPLLAPFEAYIGDIDQASDAFTLGHAFATIFRTSPRESMASIIDIQAYENEGKIKLNLDYRTASKCKSLGTGLRNFSRVQIDELRNIAKGLCEYDRDVVDPETSKIIPKRMRLPEALERYNALFPPRKEVNSGQKSEKTSPPATGSIDKPAPQADPFDHSKIRLDLTKLPKRGFDGDISPHSTDSSPHSPSSPSQPSPLRKSVTTCDEITDAPLPCTPRTSSPDTRRRKRSGSGLSPDKRDLICGSPYSSTSQPSSPRPSTPRSGSPRPSPRSSSPRTNGFPQQLAAVARFFRPSRKLNDSIATPTGPSNSSKS